MSEHEPESPKRQSLSTPQVLHLMRLEMEQALRNDYPISCMVIGLDAFDDPAERHHRATIMPDAFRLLKATTFERDVRGLGVWTETYLVAVFPHVTPERIAELAAQMNEGALGLRNPSVLHQGPITLSIGISHNLHPGEMSFEILVGEAETGMGLAQSGGGNRFVQARDVETEIDRLREEIDHQIREIEATQEALFGDAPGLEENWGRNLSEKVIDLFEREPEQSAGILRLKKEVVALITMEVANWQNSSSVKKMLDSASTIDRLERRVRKLTDSLGVTEGELKKVAQMKNIDLGVSSIYRTVQGLSSDDQFAEAKQEMLKDLFEANVALRQAVKQKI